MTMEVVFHALKSGRYTQKSSPSKLCSRMRNCARPWWPKAGRRTAWWCSTSTPKSRAKNKMCTANWRDAEHYWGIMLLFGDEERGDMGGDLVVAPQIQSSL